MNHKPPKSLRKQNNLPRITNDGLFKKFTQLRTGLHIIISS